jgi:hypothetical protein
VSIGDSFFSSNDSDGNDNESPPLTPHRNGSVSLKYVTRAEVKSRSKTGDTGNFSSLPLSLSLSLSLFSSPLYPFSFPSLPPALCCSCLALVDSESSLRSQENLFGLLQKQGSQHSTAAISELARGLTQGSKGDYGFNFGLKQPWDTRRTGGGNRSDLEVYPSPPLSL